MPEYKVKDADYLSDSHIWKLIEQMEVNIDSCYTALDFQKDKRKLNKYLAALLKYDWERSKQEIGGIPEYWAFIVTFLICIFIDVMINISSHQLFFSEFIVISTLFYFAFIYFCAFCERFKYKNMREWKKEEQYSKYRKTENFSKTLYLKFIMILAAFSILYSFFTGYQVWNSLQQTDAFYSGRYSFVSIWKIEYSQYLELRNKENLGTTNNEMTEESMQPENNTPIFGVVLYGLSTKIFFLACITIENHIRHRIRYEQDAYSYLIEEIEKI